MSNTNKGELPAGRDGRRHRRRPRAALTVQHGTAGDAGFTPEHRTGVLAPLHDPAYFAQVTLDPEPLYGQAKAHPLIAAARPAAARISGPSPATQALLIRAQLSVTLTTADARSLNVSRLRSSRAPNADSGAR
jgi:hypothetical protein